MLSSRNSSTGSCGWNQTPLRFRHAQGSLDLSLSGPKDVQCRFSMQALHEYRRLSEQRQRSVDRFRYALSRAGPRVWAFKGCPTVPLWFH